MASDFKVLKKKRKWQVDGPFSKYIQTLECDIFMDIGENVL